MMMTLLELQTYWTQYWQDCRFGQYVMNVAPQFKGVSDPKLFYETDPHKAYDYIEANYVEQNKTI